MKGETIPVFSMNTASVMSYLNILDTLNLSFGDIHDKLGSSQNNKQEIVKYQWFVCNVLSIIQNICVID